MPAPQLQLLSKWHCCEQASLSTKVCLPSALGQSMPRLVPQRPTSHPQRQAPRQEPFKPTYLIVDHHDRDQRSVRSNGVLQLLEVNQPILLDGQVGDVKATVLQVARAVQHTPVAGPGGCSTGLTCRRKTIHRQPKVISVPSTQAVHHVTCRTPCKFFLRAAIEVHAPIVSRWLPS